MPQRRLPTTVTDIQLIGTFREVFYSLDGNYIFKENIGIFFF